MIYPKYTDNNIVNLTSSILKAFDIGPLYSPLKELEDLIEYKNIILLVIDGLGYEYLRKYGRNSFLEKNYLKTLTSVFPSTTASALTTLETGVAPQQHGITGWFMLLKELGLVATILRYKPRYGGVVFPNNKIQRDYIYTEKRITDKIKQSSFIIYPEEIIDGKVNRKKKNILTYKKENNMLSRIKEAVQSSKRKKYIYAYWDGFDALCHKEGCAGEKTYKHFWDLDRKISSFIKSLKGTGSTVIITADHGLIDTITSKTIYLNDYPEIYETLTLPLCGEARTAYCYVHPEKAEEFERHVKTKLDYFCNIYKSSELIGKGFFGLYEPHKMLKDRVGDYILIMKENYVLKDKLFKEKNFSLIGNHGGISAEEIYVPLIWIKDI